MSRPRRLLTFGHSYVVGLNRRLPEEIARLDGWEVTVAAPEYFHGTRDLRAHSLDPTGSPIRVVGLRAHGTRSVHTFVYGRDLRRLLAEEWDVVHCWEEPFVLSGAQAARWTPRETPLVYYTFQNLEKRYPPPFAQLERWAMRRAAGWICSGAQVLETLNRRALYRDRPAALIPLGVDADLFRPDPARRADALRGLGWSADGPPVVGFLGRLTSEKGIALLQNALDGLTVPWRALFIGAGPLESSLRAWAATHGDQVRVLTDVAHAGVPPLLNAVDCLCAPSQTTSFWKEQFGRMLIEGFASGLPVLGSDSGEIPNVIGEAGIVLGERDEAGWREALNDLLADEGRRADLGARGRARVEAEFAWPVVARRHTEFFERLR